MSSMENPFGPPIADPVIRRDFSPSDSVAVPDLVIRDDSVAAEFCRTFRLSGHYFYSGVDIEWEVGYCHVRCPYIRLFPYYRNADSSVYRVPRGRRLIAGTVFDGNIGDFLCPICCVSPENGYPFGSVRLYKMFLRVSDMSDPLFRSLCKLQCDVRECMMDKVAEKIEGMDLAYGVSAVHSDLRWGDNFKNRNGGRVMSDDDFFPVGGHRQARDEGDSAEG